MRKTAFIGHRLVLEEGAYELLLCEIEKQIEAGCLAFTMGTHGEFDRLALSACRHLRECHPEMQIEVVLTSPTYAKGGRYGDVATVIFEIEELHYKRRIAWSNRRMIDGCDTLICYVDEAANRSGAKAALRYARAKGVKIINLYRPPIPLQMFENRENV